MAVNENETALRRIMEEGFNQGRMEVLDELVSPDLVEHQPRGPQMPLRGQDAVKAVVESLRRSFPDIHYTIEDLVVQDDKVWARLTASATQTGPFMGHEPTGRPMAIDVIDIARFQDGRMIEHWGVPDRLGAMMQLGLIPEPSATRS